MSDPLSDILDLIGVQCSVYFQKDFCAPWGMRIENTGFAQFHILVRGMAVVEFDDGEHHLSSGDVLLFPKGASHTICDSKGGPVITGQEVIEGVGRGEDMFASAGLATRMVCGHFEYDFNYRHPLIQELPDVILIRSEYLPETINLVGVLNILIAESGRPGPGSNAIVRKLSDALLVFILRAYFDLNKDQIKFHNGLGDPRIARALEAIHQQNWSDLGLDRLATIAGMSRSAFAQKFKQLIGYSPREYAVRWKLLNAASRLRDTETSIEILAQESDYASSTAFSRSFSEMFGMTPSQFRKQEKGELKN